MGELVAVDILKEGEKYTIRDVEKCSRAGQKHVTYDVKYSECTAMVAARRRYVTKKVGFNGIVDGES